MERACGICGISESQTKLKPAINGRELILACQKCMAMEDLIPVNKPTEEQLNYANKPYSVRERLARAMGTTSVKQQEPIKPLPTPSLYCISPYRKTEMPIKLVENFHWKIMMTRKRRKMSQDLLAQKIGEQVIVVKTLESGCIARDSERIIKKIEDVLGIDLRNESPVNQSSQAQSSKNQEQESGKVLVTRENIRTLKVADLIKVRDEMESKKNSPAKESATEEGAEDEIDLEIEDDK